MEILTTSVVEIVNSSPNLVMDTITLVELKYQLFINSESFRQS